MPPSLMDITLSLPKRPWRPPAFHFFQLSGQEIFPDVKAQVPDGVLRIQGHASAATTYKSSYTQQTQRLTRSCAPLLHTAPGVSDCP
jgi:hypothetical protein